MPYAPEEALRANCDHPDSRIATAFHAAHSVPLAHAGFIRRASAALAAGSPPPGPAIPTPAPAWIAWWMVRRIDFTIAPTNRAVKSLYMFTAYCPVRTSWL